jgi:hypothetical protein
MGAKLLFESGDVGKALNLSAVRVRQLAVAGALPVAFRTPRGGYLFAPATIRAFARKRSRSYVEREEIDAFIAARRQRGKSPVENAGAVR